MFCLIRAHAGRERCESDNDGVVDRGWAVPLLTSSASCDKQIELWSSRICMHMRTAEVNGDIYGKEEVYFINAYLGRRAAGTGNLLGSRPRLSGELTDRCLRGGSDVLSCSWPRRSPTNGRRLTKPGKAGLPASAVISKTLMAEPKVVNSHRANRNKARSHAPALFIIHPQSK